jgi:peptide/nickel transport system permease protein
MTTFLARNQAAPLEELAAESEVPPGRKPFGLGAKLSMAWLGLLVFCAVFADLLPLSDPNEAKFGYETLGPFQTGRFPLGADANGRDLLARTIYGARTSLVIAVCAVAFGLIIGGILGLIAGYFRNAVSTALVSLFDILLAIPQLVLALALVAVLKGDPNVEGGFHMPTVLVLILALGLVSIPILARITRANTLTWSQREFVTAARAQGAGHFRIMVREVLPNVLPAMLSITFLGVAVAIVAEGGLALLGASVDAPTSTWGTMIATGREQLREAPFIVGVPITAIFLTVMALNFLGDAIRDRFDVRESAL